MTEQKGKNKAYLRTLIIIVATIFAAAAVIGNLLGILPLFVPRGGHGGHFS